MMKFSHQTSVMPFKILQFLLTLMRICRVQTNSGAHPASLPMGTRCSFPGGKGAEAWSWQLIYIQCRGKEYVEIYLHSPNTPSCRGAQLKHRDNFTFTYGLLLHRKLQTYCPFISSHNSC
jgi:hypothetical protein